jgi:hypothetical protein
MTSFAQQKTPHQVIDEIRSSIVPDLDSVPDGVKVSVRNLQTQLSNALHLLSHDLYSEKSHFVLELVQNADDNSYEPDVTPHLTFEVTPDRLVVVNNEKGFQHEHIRAICSTGASSKSKDKTGYIGEKGIGFKSVFTVSDAPEIHSNGFHIKFDRTDEENLLGYIVPEWCEPRKDVRSGCTTIILPAAGAYEFGTETLVDLDARLLLFLNTLRQLTLAYDGQRVTYRRQDEGAVSHLTTAREVDGGDVELEKMRYVRVSSSYAMEGAHADSEKRAGIGHSTIIMERQNWSPPRTFLPSFQSARWASSFRSRQISSSAQVERESSPPDRGTSFCATRSRTCSAARSRYLRRLKRYRSAT